MAEENPAGQDAVLEDKFGKYYNKSYQDLVMDTRLTYIAGAAMLWGITWNCAIGTRTLVILFAVFAISLHILSV